MCCKQTGEIPSIKTRLSSTDWTGFIIEWTNTKHMSLLFSALFAHIVDRTWPECFSLFRIKGGWGGCLCNTPHAAIVTNNFSAVSQSHEGELPNAALLWFAVNRPWLSATHSFTWLAVINMQRGSLWSSRQTKTQTDRDIERTGEKMQQTYVLQSNAFSFKYQHRPKIFTCQE